MKGTEFVIKLKEDGEAADVLRRLVDEERGGESQARGTTIAAAGSNG